LFARHRIRCTRQRLAVYETLRAARCHPTAEQLHQMVRPSVGGLSLATVYNTLDVLVQSGLCRRMPTTDGCCRYDADTSEHLHLRDRFSGQILDGPPDLSEALVRRLPSAVLREIEERFGVRICGVSVQLQVEPVCVAGTGDGRYEA
jgi:Fur family peroxide stress response transcriptional regulator